MVAVERTQFVISFLDRTEEPIMMILRSISHLHLAEKGHCTFGGGHQLYEDSINSSSIYHHYWNFTQSTLKLCPLLKLHLVCSGHHTKIFSYCDWYFHH